jgi:HKD family nuclease
MEKIISGIHLPAEVSTIIEEAEKFIYIVCPFIELHHHFRRALSRHLNNDKVKIIILFGKFTNNTHYKLLDDDFNFLKSFPNIEIRYHARLHAKFYANEKTALATSFNMNHSSHSNNVEYGIHIDVMNNTIAKELFDFIHEILDEGQLVFEKVPSSSTIQVNSPDEQIAKYRAAFPKAYDKWTPYDDERLEKLFCEKKSIDEIARLFQRQPGAIRSRINKLELYEKYAL